MHVTGFKHLPQLQLGLEDSGINVYRLSTTINASHSFQCLLDVNLNLLVNVNLVYTLSKAIYSHFTALDIFNDVLRRLQCLPEVNLHLLVNVNVAKTLSKAIYLHFTASDIFHAVVKRFQS